MALQSMGKFHGGKKLIADRSCRSCSCQRMIQGTRSPPRTSALFPAQGLLLFALVPPLSEGKSHRILSKPVLLQSLQDFSNSIIHAGDGSPVLRISFFAFTPLVGYMSMYSSEPTGRGRSTEAICGALKEHNRRKADPYSPE